MKMDFVYGIFDDALAAEVNRRMADGWYLFTPPQFHWSNMGNCFAAFTFCDEAGLALYGDIEPPDTATDSNE